PGLAWLDRLEAVANGTNTRQVMLTNIGGQEYEWLQLNVTSPADLTGLANGSDGPQEMLTNIGRANLNIKHPDPGSSRANPIITPDGVDYIISPPESVVLRYDGATQRWRVIGRAGARGWR